MPNTAPSKFPKTLILRVTKEQQKTLVDEAKHNDLSISEYVRRILDNRSSTPHARQPRTA